MPRYEEYKLDEKQKDGNVYAVGIRDTETGDVYYCSDRGDLKTSLSLLNGRHTPRSIGLRVAFKLPNEDFKNED